MLTGWYDWYDFPIRIVASILFFQFRTNNSRSTRGRRSKSWMGLDRGSNRPTQVWRKSLKCRHFRLKFFSSYEIIYQFGGIYLDTDSKSIKPFGVSFQHSFVCYDGGWNTLGKPLKIVC